MTKEKSKKSKKSILIVEDSKDQLLRYTHLVSKQYKAFGVSNLEDAIKTLNSKSIDILISDIHLSHSAAQNSFEGFELIKFVKENFPEVLVLSMSSDPKVETYHQALSFGAQHFLRKPILNVSEINLAIEVASERKKLVRDDNERKSSFRDSIIMNEDNRKIAQRLSENIDIPVLIKGETGTGKEVFARLIHSYREDKSSKVPFVAVNCATLNKETSASILFGHKKGSFTGAHETTEGYIGEANGGILFLDEIHHLTADCQARLLRVLNDGTYSRFGDSRDLKSEFQVVAASTVSLDKLVDQGSFLLDLRMRLTGVDIRLKSLKDRADEIGNFTSLFFNKKSIKVSPENFNLIVEKLKTQAWPGNIRQLNKVLQVAAFNASLNSEELSVEHLPLDSLRKKGAFQKNAQDLSDVELKVISLLREDNSFKQSVEFFERSVLKFAIDRHKSIADVCRKLGMGRSSLDSKRIKYDLD